VRDKGMGSEALGALVRALRDAGVRALSLEVKQGDRVAAFYERLGFERREKYHLLTAHLERD
jgi:ribosomal protein S18 acetylase RimI-like enzyme